MSSNALRSSPSENVKCSVGRDKLALNLANAGSYMEMGVGASPRGREL